MEFTGPLPRTFIGSIVVGLSTLPIKLILWGFAKLYMQYAGRLSDIYFLYMALVQYCTLQ